MKRFFEDESGMGVVEVILIIVEIYILKLTCVSSIYR